MTSAQHAFSSIPSTDHLSLFSGATPKGKRVVEILQLRQKDVAKAAKVPPTSVRYDGRVPDALQKWFHVNATIINLVAQHFGDAAKTQLWFSTPNPLLGSITPIDMIRMGRHLKLLSFVQTALDENKR